MKTIRLTILFLFLPVVFFGQTLTGLWIGSLSNDSTTLRKDQSFELVLTQYKNKVYGYSRSTFIVNDTLFYIVKRVKGTIEGDVCEVKDDEVISYNFKGRLDKGVKMISTFHFDSRDSSWKMDGEWKTNKTKKYYSVSGTLDLQEEKDLEKSKIFPHLEELKLADDVAFYKESKKEPEPVAVAKKPEIKTQNEQPAKKEPAAVAVNRKQNSNKIPNGSAVNHATTQPPADKVASAVASEPAKKNPESSVSPGTVTSKPANIPKKETAVAIADPKKQAAKPDNQKPIQPEPTGPVSTPTERKETTATIVAKQTPSGKNNPATMNATPEVDKPKPTVAPAAALVSERKVTIPQIINFSSDSLVLALYDNGEVDGDTVSVLLNGEIILAKQGLKASATKKTIYVPPGTGDSMTLVLYAENLGKYPPNTGLLVVYDGEERYQVRFSADLQQNAAVIFRRKSK